MFGIRTAAKTRLYLFRVDSGSECSESGGVLRHRFATHLGKESGTCVLCRGYADRADRVGASSGLMHRGLTAFHAQRPLAA